MPISTGSMSLVERKKLQWAKEREEMASLGGSWGPTEQALERNRQETKAPVVPYDHLKRDKDTRRGSLPPLYKNQYNSYDKEKDIGGETSGYVSDNPNQTPECIQNWHQVGYESSSSRDDRPKWGDKGVGVGKFWQPKDEGVVVNEPPNWVKRGLKDGEIVVNNTSPAESPEQRYEESERPYTGSSYSYNRNTYIRGQNIHIDSVELAERERKRQIAMSHQEAVRQQLEDRERRRREECERRIKEEHEEELRIERDQEIERQRKENELKAMKEKQERDRKRKEAIQEAIELAQKEAMLEKSKRIHRQNNLKNTNVDNEKRVSSASETEVGTKSDKEDNQVDEKKSNCEQLNNTRKVSSKNELLNNEVNNNNLEIRGKGIHSPRTNNEVDNSTQEENLTYQNTLNNNLLQTPRTQNLALVFQAPLDNIQNLQYALLVPATPQNIPIAVPIGIPTSDRSCNTARTENRLLTPTQYRNRNRRLCDSSTQTDDIYLDRLDSYSSKEKPSNLELAYENRNRKERRSRSESLEERPKWGANRPPTRYVKQSEKDLLYQRRKLREKVRDRNSSDESQTGSPIFRKKEKRATWRKNNQMFTRNVKMYRTEIVPLELDKDQLYYNNEGCCVCRCGRHKCPEDSIKVDILKIEHNSPRDNVQYKTEMIETSEKLPHLNNDILDKLTSLHNGLLMKQESWDNNSPSSVSSATRQ